MILKTIVRSYISYTQRALTPSAYSAMLRQNLKNQSLPEIMHNLYLYENNIQLFDYDYYQLTCYKILDHQKKMSVSEILTVLKLGIKHNIKNQMIWKHLEAELHRRLYNLMNPLFLAQKKQQQQGLKKAFQKLQAKSQDYFQILTQQFVEETKKSQPQKQIQPIKQQTPVAQISSVPQKKKTQQIAKLSYDLVQVLIWYGCNNNNFLKLLLQTQLHPSVSQKTPYSIIRFAQLLTYICQINMKQYENNKNKYTARSLKGIFKLQSAYLPDLMRNLKESISAFSAEDIKYLTQVINSFPVKKRQHRLKIVELISNQWNNRNRDLLIQQKGKLEEILANDKKLVVKFRQANNLIQQTNQNQNEQQQKQQQKQHTEQKSQQKQI